MRMQYTMDSGENKTRIYILGCEAYASAYFSIQHKPVDRDSFRMMLKYNDYAKTLCCIN